MEAAQGKDPPPINKRNLSTEQDVNLACNTSLLTSPPFLHTLQAKSAHSTANTVKLTTWKLNPAIMMLIPVC